MENVVVLVVTVDGGILKLVMCLYCGRWRSSKGCSGLTDLG